MVAFSVLLTLIGCDSDGQDINDDGTDLPFSSINLKLLTFQFLNLTSPHTARNHRWDPLVGIHSTLPLHLRRLRWRIANSLECVSRMQSKASRIHVQDG